MAGYIGNNPSDTSVRIARQIYTTSGSQTDFTFAAGYDPGYIEIYVNGSRQTEGTNFTANDGSVFTILNGGVGAGVTVEAAAYKAFNLASVTLGEVTDVDDLTISGQIAAGTGDIGIATITAAGIDIGVGIFTGDGSGLTGVASTDNITTSTPAEFQQINVSGIATIGVTTISTSVAVGAAVTISATAITVDPAVTTTIDGDVNFQGGNYNISRSRANSSIDFDDNAKARFGTGADGLEIYHDASDSIINDNGTGTLKLQVAGATKAELTAIGTKVSGELEVTSGVQATGVVTATSFAGDGSALSGVGGEFNITSGLFL